MDPQFTILSLLEMEVMMNVMKESVTNKAGQQARQETQDEVELQPVGEDIPHACHHRGNYEPRHRDQRFGRLVMFLVADMGRRPPFVVDPSMKGIFSQAKAQEAGAEGQAQNQDVAVQDDCLPEEEEHHRQRIADKAKPVVAAASRQTDQKALFGSTNGFRFTVLVDRHLPILWFFREVYEQRRLLFASWTSALPVTRWHILTNFRR